VQGWGDAYGTVVHVFERECSGQRALFSIRSSRRRAVRPALTPEQRNKIC